MWSQSIFVWWPHWTELGLMKSNGDLWRRGQCWTSGTDSHARLEEHFCDVGKNDSPKRDPEHSAWSELLLLQLIHWTASEIELWAQIWSRGSSNMNSAIHYRIYRRSTPTWVAKWVTGVIRHVWRAFSQLLGWPPKGSNLPRQMLFSMKNTDWLIKQSNCCGWEHSITWQQRFKAATLQMYVWTFFL